MIKGLHFVRTARPGKPVAWYVYAWRGGPRLFRVESAKRPKFTANQVRAALAQLPARDDGLLSQLIRLWRGNVPGKASPEWQALAQGTRDLWGAQLDRIEEKWGKSTIAVWNDTRMIGKVVAWRDSRAATPRAADQGVTVLGELLKFGILRGKLSVDVTAGVPALYRGADRAGIILTPADIAAYHASADGLTDDPAAAQAAKDIIDLATTTGLRRADLAGVLLSEVTDHAIMLVARKKSRGRRRRAVIPLTAQARAVIDRLRTRPRSEGVETLLVTSKGKAWAPASLTMTFNKVRDAANGGGGIVQSGNPALDEPDRKKHLHDCRGTFVTHLCQTDLTNEEIGRIVAWAPDNVERVRRIYVDDAAVVIALAERIEAAQTRRKGA